MMRAPSDRLWSALRWGIVILVAVYMIVPMTIVAIISFSSAAFLTFPPPGFSLQWYQRALSPTWLEPLWTSALIMAPSAILATTLGIAAAVGLARLRAGWANGIRALLMAPLVVPAIITGAAMYSAYRPLGLVGTIPGLMIAHTVLSLPFTLSTVSSSLEMVDPQIEQAAANCGASPWVVFRTVTLPLVFPGVLSSFLFALVISFDELIASIFLTSPGTRTITVQMWSNLRGDLDPTISALATLLFLFALSILVLESIFGRGESNR
jgi:putative spermidine/putrescine transport system permease protein